MGQDNATAAASYFRDRLFMTIRPNPGTNFAVQSITACGTVRLAMSPNPRHPVSPDFAPAGKAQLSLRS